MLRRAAATIKAYRDDIGYSGTRANDTGSDDVVFDLESIGSIVEIFPAARVSAAMLEAVECIKARTLCDKKPSK
ncbi:MULTISPECIES: hypothetical protein [unclassified Mesorhizobium]|uniref:hypothetical protein n=1 Tax=unclassified Mesorhizobium TaxID=325217 RepID=UPI00333A2C1C